jgi:hypothetical protein
MSGPLIHVGKAKAGIIEYELPERVRAAQLASRFPDTSVEVEIREFQEKRSDRQNRAFHAMVSPWAKERGWRIEALKQFLLKQVFGVLEFTDPRTGEVHEVLAEPHTSKLKVSKFAELIEATLELAAEDGLFLMAPDEYRRAKQAAARKAAKAA